MRAQKTNALSEMMYTHRLSEFAGLGHVGGGPAMRLRVTLSAGENKTVRELSNVETKLHFAGR